jgi:fucose permease
VVLFVVSPLCPLIFGQSMIGLHEEDMAIASSGLIMTELGAGLGPVLFGFVADKAPVYSYAYIVPTCCYTIAFCYAVYLFRMRRSVATPCT